jgi:hypothetical protein
MEKIVNSHRESGNPVSIWQTGNVQAHHPRQFVAANAHPSGQALQGSVDGEFARRNDYSRIIAQFPNKSSWRKGWFLNPFCHLVIKAIRADSPP